MRFLIRMSLLLKYPFGVNIPLPQNMTIVSPKKELAGMPAFL